VVVVANNTIGLAFGTVVMPLKGRVQIVGGSS